jgi:hypothetical protein
MTDPGLCTPTAAYGRPALPSATNGRSSRLKQALAVSAAVLLAALIATGCGADTTTTSAPERPANRVNERRQARERATRDVVAYCTALGRWRDDPTTAPRPSRTSQRRAVTGVDFLASSLATYDGSSYERQLPVRRLLADLASYLEREDCLRRLAPRVDRALRLVALPDATEPVDPSSEEGYEPPPPDDYSYPG